MERSGFKMFLLPGQAEEYRRRHDALWPELRELLYAHGVRNYSIYLDEASLTLFAYLEAPDLRALDALPTHPVMQRWWAYMGDIMETNADQSPRQEFLLPMFYLA